MDFSVDTSLFGVPAELPLQVVASLIRTLDEVWRNQVSSLPDGVKRQVVARHGASREQALLDDLFAMKYWFDPIASGKRLRAALDAVPDLPIDVDDFAYPELLLSVEERSAILTPEGRVVLWTLTRARDSESAQDSSDPVYLEPAVSNRGLAILHEVYRGWNRQRIDSVTGLLSAETATLRPTAAGLLLVLLINRNTAPSRKLPAPEDQVTENEVARAIAAPAIAFARALTDSDKASSRGLDLYRGWAMGEISRRLGRGLHHGADGIWIQPEYEEVALARLAESLRDRAEKVRLRIPEALSRTLEEYERVRPALSALGIAHERPSNTRALKRALLAGANDGSASNGVEP